MTCAGVVVPFATFYQMLRVLSNCTQVERSHVFEGTASTNY